MNLDSLSFALSQISYSVLNLNKKNFKSTCSELNHLTATHGDEAERHLFRCLFSHIDFNADGKTSNGKDAFQIQLLQQECSSLISKANCASVLCFAVENPLQQQKTLKPASQLLPQISKILKLNKLQEVVFGISLLNSSNHDIRTHAKSFVKEKFPDLVSCFLDAEGGGRDSGLNEAPVEILHQLLLQLLSGENICGVPAELREQFVSALKREFPCERAPVVLIPLLYGERSNLSSEQLNPTTLSLPRSVMESFLADALREIGYCCTSDKDRCRQTLTQLGGVREVTAPAIAQVLGMMAKTVQGLQEGIHMQTLNMPNSLWVSEQRPEAQSNQKSWNVEIFVQVVQELAPSLNWRDVVKEFDHTGFLIPNQQGLKLVVTAIRLALHGKFPVEELYKPWQNSEGQLSWFVHSLNNPDIFSFSMYTRQTVNLEMLKAIPDDDNSDVATWKCIELVDILLKLSDQGHYQQVSELFKLPVQHCPDILVINLLQSPSPWNVLKKELLYSMLPYFLGNHPNATSVLNCIWNSNHHLGALVMLCMADWYHRDQNDQTRLSRILDVAQDLKALSALLNISQFAFVVDLACLASRREYLKLDKWLSDKIREHRTPFIEAVVAFLKRKCPALMGMKDELPMQPSKVQLSPETIATILALLQPCIGNIQNEELVKDITIMLSNAGPLVNLSKQRPGITPSHHGLPQSMTGMDSPFGVLQPSTPGGSPAKFAGSVSSSGNVGLPGPTNSSNSLHGIQNMSMHRTDMGLGGGRVSAPGVQQVRMPQQQPPQVGPSSSKEGFSEDVEEEANSYFTKIYHHPPANMSIDEVLDMLKRFKDSTNNKEREVFSCMLRNLFEENKFFPQYPERELEITALLFGGIIEQGLVQHMALGLALKYVLEALKHDPNSKMFMFGVTALDRFRSRLKDCSQYCQHIVTIPHFQQFPKHLIEYVEFGKNSMEPPSASSARLGGVIPPQAAQPPVTSTTLPPAPVAAPTGATTASAPGQGMPAVSSATQASSSPAPGSSAAPGAHLTAIGLPTKGKPSLAHTTNIDTLLAGADDKQEISVPPEAIQDKVFFIFNNLSQMNMSQKAEELLQTLKDDFVPWSAQYLVMKRASIEPNFHPLYSSFLDSLNNPDLYKRVLLETYRNIKVLLRSDKGVSNFSDRSLLKNLGHWLGLMTLARNKPIKQLDLDLKALLYEANRKGSDELLYVVPFVAKVLESSEKSKVFRPPNPWTMGILNVLAELHQQQDLKLNLKFEIEVLCKNLKLDIQILEPTGYLDNPAHMAHIECQLSTRRQEETINYSGDSNANSSLININVPRSVPMSTPEPQLSNVPAGQQAQTMSQQGYNTTQQSAPQPQYAYNDIITSLPALAPHIQASDSIPLFTVHRQLKSFVKPAVERAIQELLIPVVDRSIKIALTTCESIIKKDFALDPEEIRMRGAAHHIVRSMTAGMALITCREPLLLAISNYLKQAFIAALRTVSPQQKEMIEQAVQVIAQDNTELACAFIQKTAVEKAIPEIDKKLNAEFELRQSARQQGQRYFDRATHDYQNEKMPEILRMKPGSANPQQMSVYEEFARQVPGFAASNISSDLLGQQGPPHNRQNMSFIADEISAVYDKISEEIENQIQVLSSGSAASNYQPQITALKNLLDIIKTSTQNRDVAMAALTMLQKTVESLLEGFNNTITDTEFAQRFRDCHLLVLKGLQDPRAFGPQWTNKHVTRLLTECREDYKYNDVAVECLIRQGLVNLSQYDFALTTSMENGQNYMAVTLAMQLVQKLILDGKGTNSQVTESDLTNTIEALAKVASVSRQAPEGLSTMIEALRQQNDGGLLPGSTAGPTSMMQSGINQAKEVDDPQGLHEKVEFLLREWVNMYHSPQAGRDSTKAFQTFVTQMHQQGILKTDDLITRFFRLCTEMCVELTYGTLKSHGANPAIVRAKCFQTLDAYVRLIVLLVKLSGDSSNTMTKINLLNKVLGIVAGVLLQDHEVRGKEFSQLPYHRIFIMLFIELNAPEHILDTINFQVLTAFVHTYRILRPAKVPGFAFAWLELISHRVFIGRMLQLTAQQRGWGLYAQLLIDLFKFLAPFLRNADLNRAMAVLYKGTLRVLLVLLHDFPEFLCDYHYAFCDVIPPNCIQMRNLILSAFPRNMRLPDPFTPNLKVDMLTEIAHTPKITTNVPMIIQPEQFRKDLDSYLKSRSPVTFLSELRGHLQVNNDPGNRYDIPLINALVLYVGTQAINYIQSRGMSPSTSTIAHSSHMDIFQNLAVDLDTEGRYLFLNAITNQLRFPNSHTHYFSCALLYLFSEANSEALQEQITRVLLERLIVNRPHPWGLLVTFIELIRNQQYKFWSHEFVRCAPEIERLFETVARSCNQSRNSQQPSTANSQNNELSVLS